MATARQLVREAEQRLAEIYALRLVSRTQELGQPAMDLRVLEAGEGRPVIFLHDAGELSSLWIPMWAAMEGVRCIGVDLPGFGLSGEVDYRDVDLRKLGIEVVRAVLDGLELDEAPLVGNGLGGAFALWATLDVPGRVSSLALFGAPVPAVDRTRVNTPVALLGVRYVNRAILDLPLPPLAVNRALYRYTLGRDAVDGVPDEVVEIAHYAMDRPTFAPSMTSYMEQVFRFRKPRRDYLLDKSRLAEVRPRTLLLWGDRDRFGGPEVADDLVGALPDARVEVVEGGHNPWLQQPERCAEILGAFIHPDRN